MAKRKKHALVEEPRWSEPAPLCCLASNGCRSTVDVHDVDAIMPEGFGYPKLTIRTRLCVACRPLYQVKVDRGVARPTGSVIA